VKGMKLRAILNRTSLQLAHTGESGARLKVGCERQPEVPSVANAAGFTSEADIERGSSAGRQKLL